MSKDVKMTNTSGSDFKVSGGAVHLENGPYHIDVVKPPTRYRPRANGQGLRPHAHFFPSHNEFLGKQAASASEQARVEVVLCTIRAVDIGPNDPPQAVEVATGNTRISMGRVYFSYGGGQFKLEDGYSARAVEKWLQRFYQTESSLAKEKRPTFDELFSAVSERLGFSEPD